MEKLRVACYGDGSADTHETYASDSSDAIEKIMSRHPGYDEYYCGDKSIIRTPKIISKNKIVLDRKKLQKKPLPVPNTSYDLDMPFNI